MHRDGLRSNDALRDSGRGADELRLLLPEERTNLRAVVGSAGLSHAAFLLVLFMAMWLRPDRQVPAVLPDTLPDDIVHIEMPGPSGGGGGGGNQREDPPKVEQLPAARPPEPAPVVVPDPEQVPEPEVLKPEAPIITPRESAAVISTAPAPVASTSLGTGDGGGAGTGERGGIGDGNGTGIGRGRDRGTGGDAFDVGNGVTAPILVASARPKYTQQGMVRRMEGEVELHCIVLATGIVGPCDIVMPLDRNLYGLDDEAMRAATQFRFRPGTHEGKPVNVRVRIVLEFNMR